MAKLFGRGYQVIEEETKRREMAQESRKGKLYRFFFGKNESEADITFLTEEPICYQEHSLRNGETYSTVPCAGEGCPYCKEGKPRFVASWLIVDHRSYEAKVYDENNVDTGKKKTVKDRVKVLVRGVQDAGVLKRISDKFGLTKYVFTVVRTGAGKSTRWDFERGVDSDLSATKIKEYREQLPEKLRNLDFYKILEMQVSTEDEAETPSREDVKEAASKGVQTLEEAPKRTAVSRFIKK